MVSSPVSFQALLQENSDHKFLLKPRWGEVMVWPPVSFQALFEGKLVTTSSLWNLVERKCWSGHQLEFKHYRRKLVTPSSPWNLFERKWWVATLFQFLFEGKQRPAVPSETWFKGNHGLATNIFSSTTWGKQWPVPSETLFKGNHPPNKVGEALLKLRNWLRNPY